MSELPKETTTPTRDEFVSSMRRALMAEGLPVLSTLSIALLFAQFAFETGWGRYCFCYNLGNVRASSGWIAAGGDYFELPSAWEIVKGKKVVTGGKFRAHRDLDEGCEDHVLFLSSLSTYAPAWAVIVAAANIEQHDVSEFVVAHYAERFVTRLKEGGYFTGDELEYIHGVASIAQAFIKSVAFDSMDSITQPDTPQALNREAVEGAALGSFTAMQALEYIFDDQWSDETTANFLACRYDCDGLV